jgi:hypothetical protein
MQRQNAKDGSRASELQHTGGLLTSEGVWLRTNSVWILPGSVWIAVCVWYQPATHIIMLFDSFGCVRDVIGFELRASCLLGLHFIPWAMPPALSTLFIYFSGGTGVWTQDPMHSITWATLSSPLVIFWIRSPTFCLSWPWTVILPLSLIAGIIDVYTTPHLLCSLR